MKLNNYLGLVKSDILSIVGAGGKTTMLFKLSEELREFSKILVTTTTKIYLPAIDKYDFICTDINAILKGFSIVENGIYVLGTGINDENKVVGLSYKNLDKVSPHFDYILIEADGAKEKQLKAWNEFEPVIYGKTTKTIGIIDVQALGIVVNEDSVHRSKIFCEITGAHEGEIVKIEHLAELILNPRGLFKGSQGERILYINKVENTNDFKLAKLLVKKINLENKKLIDSVIIGSLKTNTYFNYLFMDESR